MQLDKQNKIKDDCLAFGKPVLYAVFFRLKFLTFKLI